MARIAYPDTDKLCQIETRDHDEIGPVNGSVWNPDEIGNNDPRPYAECARNLESLRSVFGEDFDEREYRIVEAA
jgi:hypothetical protein